MLMWPLNVWHIKLGDINQSEGFLVHQDSHLSSSMLRTLFFHKRKTLNKSHYPKIQYNQPIERVNFGVVDIGGMFSFLINFDIVLRSCS